LRYVFGFVFISFAPGYCLVNILFIAKNKLDFVEQLVLSIALSFGVDGIAGLFLGLSPIGINFTSITISMGIIVLVFATAAFVRRMKEISWSNMQASEQVSS
jgi:uncharacterized membrane protein